MQSLPKNIKSYYQEHYGALAFDKQLHFASRLYLWTGDAWAKGELVRLRPDVVGTDSGDLAAILKGIRDKSSSRFGSKNAGQLRAQHFERYPALKPILGNLFRMLFAETIYGIDGRPCLEAFIQQDELVKLSQELLADRTATAILSTHAVNFQYLLHRFYLRSEDGIDIAALYEIGQSEYDLSDKIQLQLFIYLYTHCIIGESLFYSRTIPAEKLEIYQRMISALEAAIEAHFENINLDNKFEFLVCAKIVGHDSHLQDKIYEEAEASVSPDGTYVIDTHNNNPQAANTTLDLSEHRNVLYILSTLPFTPAGRL